MSWVDNYDLPYATVSGNFGETSDSGVDVSALNGVITFHPTVPFLSINGAIIKITPVEASVTSGEIENIRLLATDVENDTVTNWGWRAQFKIDHFRILPVTFYAETGSVVDLPKDVRVVSGVAVETVTGPTGDTGKSAYEIAVSHGFVGTEEQWIESLYARNGGYKVELISTGIAELTGDAVYMDTEDGIVELYSGYVDDSAWSVNPLARAQGRGLTSIDYDPVTNSIYSGFGDWTRNGDYVGVVRHDLETGAATVEYAPIYSEAIERVVRLSDGLYVPHIDGKGYWEGCGYAVNIGGVWSEVTLPGQALHVFDMTENSEGTWACGSRLTPEQDTGFATVWFRPHGGEWRVEHDGARGDFARYYSLIVEDDTVTYSTQGVINHSLTIDGFVYTVGDYGKILRKAVE